MNNKSAELGLKDSVVVSNVSQKLFCILHLNSINILQNYKAAEQLFLAAAKPLLHKVEGVLEVLAELLADGAPEVVGEVALADGGRDPVVGGLRIIWILSNLVCTIICTMCSILLQIRLC